VSQVLTTSSEIDCSHKGVVQTSSKGKLTVQKCGVLTAEGVKGQSINLCKLAGPNTKPCKFCTSVTGVNATKLTVNTVPVLIDSGLTGITGITDSTPPGTLVLNDLTPVQTKLSAK
jgi:hypothetical protein